MQMKRRSRLDIKLSASLVRANLSVSDIKQHICFQISLYKWHHVNEDLCFPLYLMMLVHK